MALPAAMVLSGLPKDQFTGNLQTVFTQGSVLLKSPRSACVLQTQASSRPSTSSSSSTMATCTPSVAPSSLAPPRSAPSASAPSTSGPSPSALSTDSSLTESGIASSVSSDTEKSLDYYLNVINKIEQKFQHMHEYPNSEQHRSNITLMFEGRNVLDLGANVRSIWPFQYAALPNGVDHFFENRSQLSRVAGAQLPAHTNHACADSDCGFVEPVYH